MCTLACERLKNTRVLWPSSFFRFPLCLSPRHFQKAPRADPANVGWASRVRLYTLVCAWRGCINIASRGVGENEVRFRFTRDLGAAGPRCNAIGKCGSTGEDTRRLAASPPRRLFLGGGCPVEGPWARAAGAGPPPVPCAAST